MPLLEKKNMNFDRIVKHLLRPYSSFLKIRVKRKRAWLNKKFKNYDEVFEYEKNNDFSFTRLRGRLELGYKIDLNNPCTFNEKLIHRRLFSRDSIWPIITNKVTVRSWLKEQGHLEHLNLVPAQSF